jgi:uncharacterized OsmC-like protein
MASIRESVQHFIDRLSEHPDQAVVADSGARAVLGDDLRVTVPRPGGDGVVTDMPTDLGGAGEHPSPGWLFRAALASCVASTVGIEAARAGVSLTSLEVEVDSRSDDRGILGMDPVVHAGPLQVSIRVRARAEGVDRDRLHEVVMRGTSRSPVVDITKRAVPVSVEIDPG